MERYNLASVVTIIEDHDFQRVVLQFPDEELDHCAAVYDHLEAIFGERGVQLYITADSTWGSSIDDVSAMHIDGDLLVYFGSDLSSSGSIPCAICPPQKILDMSKCLPQLESVIDFSSETSRSILVLYEPAYYHVLQPLLNALSAKHKVAERASNDAADEVHRTVVMGKLPSCADLDNWQPNVDVKAGSTVAAAAAVVASSSSSSSSCGCSSVPDKTCMNSGAPNAVGNTGSVSVAAAVSSSTSSSGSTNGSKQKAVSVGGLSVDYDFVMNASAGATTVVYIGEKNEQLMSISLRLADMPLVTYSPATDKVTSSMGNASIQFRERYGGVARVKDANIIGIIVGSMGLTGDMTNGLLDRLQALIAAANKKHYTFVMGRLNEAKLCNFPEVDLFCLISNEDQANIKPKTFHVPVITPFELELGLGARDWQSFFCTDSSTLLGSSDSSGDSADFWRVLEKVREYNRPEYESESDSSDDDESIEKKKKAAAAVAAKASFVAAAATADRGMELAAAAEEGEEEDATTSSTTTSTIAPDAQKMYSLKLTTREVGGSSSRKKDGGIPGAGVLTEVPGPANQQLSVFRSPAADFFHAERTYKGMEERAVGFNEFGEEQQLSKKVHMGNFGTASTGYVTMQQQQEQSQPQEQQSVTAATTTILLQKNDDI